MCTRIPILTGADPGGGAPGARPPVPDTRRPKKCTPFPLPFTSHYICDNYPQSIFLLFSLCLNVGTYPQAAMIFQFNSILYFRLNIMAVT